MNRTKKGKDPITKPFYYRHYRSHLSIYANAKTLQAGTFAFGDLQTFRSFASCENIANYV